MSRTPDLSVPAPTLPPDKVEEIQAQLERVLSSQQFRTSRRCQNLFRHLIERTMAGDTLALKERTLGVDVFGREPDYDTNQDPVVRATAAEIRKKLAQYYQESAHDSELRIELFSGSYVPEIHLDGGAGKAAARHASAHRVIIIGAAGLGLLLAVTALALMRAPWRQSDLQQFWDPILRAQGNVIISLGQPIAYNLRSAESQDRMQFRREEGQSEMDPGVIAKKDLIVLADRYIALGDAECLVRIASLFEKQGKPYRIRGERSTSFADMRENSAVLIGAFDNPWTLRAGGQLRFTFAKDSGHDTDMVRDRQQPANKEWKLTGAWPQWDIPYDYAIVSRVLDANTDRPVVIAAGITHYGTSGAGQFLSDPQYFSEAVRRLPADWARKNLQIVLWVPVVHRAAGHPRVLATHVW